MTPAFSGGRHLVGPGGYVRVLRRGHPRASTLGYVLEHILVVEAAMGKPLSAKHPVHHVDENKGNNVAGNLVVCEDRAYHKLLHRRQRAFDACGNARARRCWICRSYERQEDIAVYGSQARHLDCYNAYKLQPKTRKTA